MYYSVIYYILSSGIEMFLEWAEYIAIFELKFSNNA